MSWKGNMENKLIAHIRKNDLKVQTLWDHLRETSEITGKFAGKVGLKETGELIGLLHDLGKASNEFQNYINSANGLIDPDADEYVDVNDKKGKIDHSSAGAQMLYRKLSNSGSEGLIAAQAMALCVASHHSGLIDCLSPSGEEYFTKRIEKSEKSTHVDEAYQRISSKEQKVIDQALSNQIPVEQFIQKMKSLKTEDDHKDTFLFKLGLLIRYLFSCLIDADRLNTADFETPQNSYVRTYGQYQPWVELIERLDKQVLAFENKEEKNEIDKLRCRVSQSCFESSMKPRGIFQLKVPTGGGKTFASLRFALNHAKVYGMDRVFYIIPYTSIIDQNAEKVREILEDKDRKGKYLDKVVLEHHSNLTPEEETRRQSLLSENWDAPIVFTTQVQFLEAMFGSGTRSARRMHQLVNSVIIFDEVQTIPIRSVQMFNVALQFLVKDCGSTVVLCTATQPLLDKVTPLQRSLKIESENHIVPEEEEIYNKFRRVQIFDQRKRGGWSEEEVAELAEKELKAKGSVLVIVNTKKSASSLFQVISRKNIAEIYHLSTNMCPAHRLKVLKEINDKLNKVPLICVSTQLIEAGVDIDFGSVIRYLAGLDSIGQAAGRCNRNGRPELGNVWIVNPESESLEKLEDIRIGAGITERVLDEFKNAPEEFSNDRIGLKAIERYYEYYFYSRSDEMNYRVGKQSLVGRNDDLFNLLSTNSLSVGEYSRIYGSVPNIPFKQSFQTAAKSFHVIDSATQGVIVPYGEEGNQIIIDLCGSYDLQEQYKLLKKAQRYSVNMFPNEFKQMAERKAIKEIYDGTGIFHLDKQYYSEKFGWQNEEINKMETLICEGDRDG